MPGNPYDDLFDNPAPDPRPERGTSRETGDRPEDPRSTSGSSAAGDPDTQSTSKGTPAVPTPRFALDIGPPDEGPDDLDRILDQLKVFETEAADFSRLLSDLRVVDHAVRGKVARIFIVADDPHDRGNLAGEKQYHELQTQKFLAIIVPMRELAERHLDTVKRFNMDIDEHYFNANKNERQVESEKTRVMDGINLQRKILNEASDALRTLTAGLIDTERRIRKYVNAGGRNNISQSEYELIVRHREDLTGGHRHRFDYRIFDTNLLDKTAITLGIYLKETSAQYLRKLGEALGG